MAYATAQLIDALMLTADRLSTGAEYQWTHMGACNCGHLAQTVTHLSRAKLHALALEKPGDWSEQAIDFCPTSGFPMDHVIATMLELGLTTQDLVHLERLSDTAVLAHLPLERRHLDYRERDDVVLYLETLAAMLAGQLASSLQSVISLSPTVESNSTARRARRAA
ncbi:MAG: hypothetical protein H7Z43_10920 [Clostridia bacterium]|nr:hypothetical protein [Deltaproteobacteria bacterium]